VPIDRAATLRNAEKLIRQGKLPDAITEYVRLVEDQPGDWNLANSLGDLYARAGQGRQGHRPVRPDADNLTRQEQARKRRRLQEDPQGSSRITSTRSCRSSDILGSQGRYADARSHLHTHIELRKGKGIRVARCRRRSASARSIRKTTKGR
jgi:hypothetical protein